MIFCYFPLPERAWSQHEKAVRRKESPSESFGLKMKFEKMGE
jgi:hypothetical protein